MILRGSLKRQILEAKRFSEFDDGIEFWNAAKKFHFTADTLYRWCLKKNPILKRLLGHKSIGYIDGDNIRKAIIVLSKKDLEHIRDCAQNPYNRALPGNAGKWIG